MTRMYQRPQKRVKKIDLIITQSIATGSNYVQVIAPYCGTYNMFDDRSFQDVMHYEQLTAGVIQHDLLVDNLVYKVGSPTLPMHTFSEDLTVTQRQKPDFLLNIRVYQRNIWLTKRKL